MLVGGSELPHILLQFIPARTPKVNCACTLFAVKKTVIKTVKKSLFMLIMF